MQAKASVVAWEGFGIGAGAAAARAYGVVTAAAGSPCVAGAGEEVVSGLRKDFAAC